MPSFERHQKLRYCTGAKILVAGDNGTKTFWRTCNSIHYWLSHRSFCDLHLWVVLYVVNNLHAASWISIGDYVQLYTILYAQEKENVFWKLRQRIQCWISWAVCCAYREAQGISLLTCQISDFEIFFLPWIAYNFAIIVDRAPANNRRKVQIVSISVLVLQMTLKLSFHVLIKSSLGPGIPTKERTIGFG